MTEHEFEYLKKIVNRDIAAGKVGELEEISLYVDYKIEQYNKKNNKSIYYANIEVLMDKYNASTRLRKGLKTAHIDYVYQLIEKEEEEYLDIKNFGIATLLELNCIMDFEGLEFANREINEEKYKVLGFIKRFKKTK